MSSLTACVQVAPNTFLSSYSTSSAGGNVSTTATVQCGSGSYTYLWSFTGITVSITNGSTATTYAWSRVSGVACTFTGATTATPTITQSGQPSILTTLVQCIITIPGGQTTTPQTTIQWGVV